MNDIHQDTAGTDAWERGRCDPPQLRLVRSERVAIAPASPEARNVSSFACPTRLRLVRRAWQEAAIKQLNERRHFDRHEGTTMDRMDKMDGWVAGVGRFVFGLGIGLALTSAYVIVSGRPDVLGTSKPEAEVVRLDPVVVTISAERFAELRAEMAPTGVSSAARISALASRVHAKSRPSWTERVTMPGSEMGSTAAMAG